MLKIQTKNVVIARHVAIFWIQQTAKPKRWRRASQWQDALIAIGGEINAFNLELMFKSQRISKFYTPQYVAIKIWWQGLPTLFFSWFSLYCTSFII